MRVRKNLTHLRSVLLSRILVTFALRQEGAPFARRLTRRAVRNGLVLGHIGTREIAVFWLGVGVENPDLFERTVAELRPQLIINSGFAGGVRSLLEAGDFVLAKNYSFPETLVGNRDVFSASGNLVSVTGIAGPETKAYLELQGNILAIDMETERVATICRKLAVPLLTARMISDRADEALPGIFAGGKLQGPVDVFHAIHFAARMLILREKLATRLCHLIEELI